MRKTENLRPIEEVLEEFRQKYSLREKGCESPVFPAPENFDRENEGESPVFPAPEKQAETQTALRERHCELPPDSPAKESGAEQSEPGVEVWEHSGPVICDPKLTARESARQPGGRRMGRGRGLTFGKILLAQTAAAVVIFAGLAALSKLNPDIYESVAVILRRWL